MIGYQWLRVHLVHGVSHLRANGWSVKPEPGLGTTPQHMATASPRPYPFRTCLYIHIQPLIQTTFSAMAGLGPFKLCHQMALLLRSPTLVRPRTVSHQGIASSPLHVWSKSLWVRDFACSEGAEEREAGGEGLPRRGAKEPEEKLSQPRGSRAGWDVRAQHSRALPLQINSGYYMPQLSSFVTLCKLIN